MVWSCFVSPALFCVTGTPASSMLSVILKMHCACASSSLPSPEQENVTCRQSSCADASLWNGWTMWSHLVLSKRCHSTLNCNHQAAFFVWHTAWIQSLEMTWVHWPLFCHTLNTCLFLAGFHLHQGNILSSWGDGAAHYMAGAISVLPWCKYRMMKCRS